MKPSMIPTLLRTLRYIPPQQLYYLVLVRLKKLYHQTPLYPLLLEREDYPSSLALQPPTLHVGDKFHAQNIVQHGSFTFVGQSVTMEHGMRWLPKETSALWRFHLHYWDWLADLAADKQQKTAQRMVEDWLLNCDQYHPEIWHPYPTSLRLVNALQHGTWLLKGAEEQFVEAYWNSLQRQASYLQNNLEWHLGANHLMKNIKALIFAGLCLPGRQSLFLEGQRLLLQQLAIQILPDGAHYEKSPSYHVQVLEDLLEIQALLRKAKLGIPPQLVDAIDRMNDALRFYIYPDGGLPLFNDGDTGEPTRLRKVLKQAGSGKLPVALEQAGYLRLEHGPLMVFVDAGKIGPDEIPGHAHAQTLAIEICWKDERIFTNCGTYAYQHPLRNTFRSTPAHNTICVDEENSAEVWSAFRVGRRPRKVAYEIKQHGDHIHTTTQHDGYRHLGVTHQRHISLHTSGPVLTGEDNITDKRNIPRRVKAHFHLHPEISCRLKDEEHALLTTASGETLEFRVEGGRLYAMPSQYAPQFGQLEESQQLIIQGRWHRGCQLKWSLKKAG